MAQNNPESAAEQFVEKWANTDLSERAASHEHFIDLCRLIDQPTYFCPRHPRCTIGARLSEGP